MSVLMIPFLPNQGRFVKFEGLGCPRVGPASTSFHYPVPETTPIVLSIFFDIIAGGWGRLKHKELQFIL